MNEDRFGSNLDPASSRWPAAGAMLAALSMALVGLAANGQPSDALVAAAADAGAESGSQSAVQPGSEPGPGAVAEPAGNPAIKPSGDALAGPQGASVGGAAATGAGTGAGEQQESEAGDEGADPDSSADSLQGEAEGPGAIEAALPSFEGLKPLAAEADVLARARLEEGRLVVDSPTGAKTLTVNATLQRRVSELLRSYSVPYGAVAAIEPATGRVLALAEHSSAQPGMRGLALKAIYPAASVFKIVTAAALLGEKVPADETVCFHGGKRRLSEKLLVDDTRRDHRCLTLTEAMGHSANVVFAKLAKRSLDATRLRGWAERFGFNERLGFVQPIDPSVARIPEAPFGLATAAAGFGEVFLSPLHGALIAAAIGNRGLLAGPVLFEGDKAKARQVVEPAMAATLTEMLETTVTEGTARRAFRERGRNALGGVRAVGKTGSLADQKPFRDYSWFVGFAPKDNPTIAVAAVIVNGSKWRVRAPYVAREALRMYLEPPRTAAHPRHPDRLGRPGRLVKR